MAVVRSANDEPINVCRMRDLNLTSTWYSISVPPSSAAANVHVCSNRSNIGSSQLISIRRGLTNNATVVNRLQRGRWSVRSRKAERSAAADVHLHARHSFGDDDGLEQLRARPIAPVRRRRRDTGVAVVGRNDSALCDFLGEAFAGVGEQSQVGDLFSRVLTSERNAQLIGRDPAQQRRGRGRPRGVTAATGKRTIRSGRRRPISSPAGSIAASAMISHVE